MTSATRPAHTGMGGPPAAVWSGLRWGWACMRRPKGIALGASVRVSLTDEGMLPGLGVCLAILLHKPLDAFSITGMMKHEGKARRARLAANVGYALICPLAAVSSYFGAGMLGAVWERRGAWLRARVRGGCVPVHRVERSAARSPLPPPRPGKLLLALLAGVALAYALYFVEAMAAHGGHTH